MWLRYLALCTGAPPKLVQTRTAHPQQGALRGLSAQRVGSVAQSCLIPCDHMD